MLVFILFTFQMSQSAGPWGEHPELEALLPARLHLPVKFYLVSSSLKEKNPMGYCLMEADTRYLISKMERIDPSIFVVYLVCAPHNKYPLPKHYAAVVSDDDIAAINNHTYRHVLIKKRRSGMPDVYDLIID
jgi:hypothetical protein